MKKIISLNGQWELEVKNQLPRAVTIPGAVELYLENRDSYESFIFYKKFLLEEKDQNKTYLIDFKGVSYFCKVSCNGVSLLEHEGIWDAFSADATNAIRTGENVLKVEVWKPDFNVESPYYFRSVLFGFIPDVMLPFGGIWKDVELRVVGSMYFEKFRPDFQIGKEDPTAIVLRSHILGKDTNSKFHVKIDLEDPTGKKTSFTKPYEETLIIPVEDTESWSPSTPNIYKCHVVLYLKEEALDSISFTGGFRNIQIQNGEILLNNIPFYMRGVLHWGCYPDRMTPTPSVEEVRKELCRIKEAGFNTVKHCLYFPPSYYYELCDEMGIVVWQELPLWLPYPNEYLLHRIYHQYPLMLDIFMQYPSVSLVSIGCELDTTIGTDTLNKLYNIIKSREPQMIICDNSGSGECFEGGTGSDSDIYDYHFYPELYQLNHLLQEFTSSYRTQKPWLFGEFNDFDTFRIATKGKSGANAWWCNPDEKINLLRKVHKGFGSDQPVYRQQEILDQYGVSEEVNEIIAPSVEQMKEVRKFILETVRSFPEIKGYNITVIQDVPITTAGIFDEHMDCKISPDFMQQINGNIVVGFQKELARIWDNGADRFLNKDRYHYEENEGLNGRIVISNRNNLPISGEYRIAVQYKEQTLCFAAGSYEVPANQVIELPKPDFILPTTEQTKCCNLNIELTHSNGQYENNWDIWLWPKKYRKETLYLLDPTDYFHGIEQYFMVVHLKGVDELNTLVPGAIVLTTIHDQTVEANAARGLKIISVINGVSILPTVSAPFFREGITRITEHPAIENISHKGYAGIQFFGIASDRVFDKIQLEKTIGGYRTLVRRYDARKFWVGEYLVEYTTGSGRVLATTLNLAGGKGEQPNTIGANRLGIGLLQGMVAYLDSPN